MGNENQIKSTNPKIFFLRLFAAFSSLFLTSVFLMSLLLVLSWAVGSNLPRYYDIQPKTRLWESVQDIGYKNRSSLMLKLFGNIIVRTNSQGFLCQREVGSPKNSGQVRIVSMGDSLLAAVNVKEEHSPLGFFREIASLHGRRIDPINANVVGYSTYQEKVFFEKYVLPLSPDIVIMNFCHNDWAPTEDPYHNLIPITSGYLSRLIHERSTHLSQGERDSIRFVLDDLQRLAQIRAAPEDIKRNLFRALIQIPIEEMARLAKSNKVRFIVLFIPYIVETPLEAKTVQTLKWNLEKQGIEFIDLYPSLLEDPSLYQSNGSFVFISNMTKLLDFPALREMNPAIIIDNTRQWIYECWIQRRRNFIDKFGHPTRKGNRIIAMEIYKYLFPGDLCTNSMGG